MSSGRCQSPRFCRPSPRLPRPGERLPCPASLPTGESLGRPRGGAPGATCRPRLSSAPASSHLPPHLRLPKELLSSLKVGVSGRTNLSLARVGVGRPGTALARVVPGGLLEVVALGERAMIHLDCVKTHVTVGKRSVRLCPCHLEQNARGAGRPLLESRLGCPFEFRGCGVTSPLSVFPFCLLPQQLRWGWGKVRKKFATKTQKQTRQPGLFTK